jgi:hypothetical protein
MYKYARKAVLREYGIWPYYPCCLDNVTLSKVIELPLPFHHLMIDRNTGGNKTLKEILLDIKNEPTLKSEFKSYNWSFIGETSHHRDRMACVDAFKSWQTYNVSETVTNWGNMDGVAFHPAQMFEVFYPRTCHDLTRTCHNLVTQTCHNSTKTCRCTSGASLSSTVEVLSILAVFGYMKR